MINYLIYMFELKLTSYFIGF